MPGAAVLGLALNPATALGLRPLRAAHCGPAQEPGILKKAAARCSQPSDPCVAAGALPPGAPTPGLGYLPRAAALPGTCPAAQRL